MKNLLDGIKNISQGELDEQIASFKVYKIGTAILLFIKNIFWFGAKVVTMILKLFGIKLEMSLRPCFASAMRRTKDKIRLLEQIDRDKLLRRQLRNYVSKSKIIVSPFIKNDDSLSAFVTKSVISLMKKEEIYGLAVTEINDYVFEKYHSIRKPNRSLLLNVWGIGAAVIGIVIALVGMANPYDNKRLWAFLFVGLQVAWYVFMERKQAKWQLAHFIWLSVSGLGGSFASKLEEMPSNKIPKTVWIENDLNLKAYHTFGYMIDSQLKKSNDLLIYKKVLVDKYNNNKENIEKIKNKTIQVGWNTDYEKRRVIYDLEKENKKIYENCVKIDEDNRQIVNTVKELRATLEELKKNEVQKLEVKWKKVFSNCIFMDRFVKRVVENFAYSEIAAIETRIYELNSLSEPFSWANKRSKQYITYFKTNNGGLGKAYYTKRSKSSNTVVLSGIERDDSLNELPITPDEIKKVIRQNGENNEEEYQRKVSIFIDILDGKDKEITNLKKEKIELENDKRDLNKQLNSKETEVKGLKYEVSKSNRKCIHLESQINDLERDKKNNSKEIKKLRDELEKEKIYQSGVLDKLKKACEELLDLSDELVIKNNKIVRLNQEISRKEQEIDRLTKQFKSEKSELKGKIEDYKKRLANSEGQLNIEISLKKQAERTIALKENEIESFKEALNNSTSPEDKQKLLDEINNQKAEILKLKKSNDKFNSIIKDNKNRISELTHELEYYIQEYNSALKLAEEYEAKYNEKFSEDIIKAETGNAIAASNEDVMPSKVYGGNVFGLKHSEQILVAGACATKTKYLIGVAKEYGLKDNHLDFWDDYDKLNHSLSRLSYNTKYRAIIIGPMPHMVEKIDGYNSFLSKLNSNKEAYPPVEVCRSASGELKISKTAFREALNNLLGKL